jgi:hypothetical protein
MSFGQGGPQWGGGGGQGQNPYGGEPQSGENPYGAPQGQFPGQAPGPGQAPPPGQGGFPGQGQTPRDPGTPDWTALADQSASRARRKRWMLIGGGAVATAAVAAIVAAAVVSTSGGSSPAASSSHGATASGPAGGAGTAPGGSPAPQPSFSSVAPQPPDPEQYVASADTDKAPLSTATLFPGSKVAFGARAYTKAATAATTSCAEAVQGSLGATLTSHGCTEFFRATYQRDGVAVTVGIAVFDKEAQAQAANKQVDGGIASLAGDGVGTFCRDGVICRRTNNFYGRYVYFTIGGYTDTQNVSSQSSDVFTAGNDLAQFTVSQLVARGQAQATAAASAPAA